jgi:hypothetical protein
MIPWNSFPAECGTLSGDLEMAASLKDSDKSTQRALGVTP